MNQEIKFFGARSSGESENKSEIEAIYDHFLTLGNIFIESNKYRDIFNTINIITVEIGSDAKYEAYVQNTMIDQLSRSDIKNITIVVEDISRICRSMQNLSTMTLGGFRCMNLQNMVEAERPMYTSFIGDSETSFSKDKLDICTFQTRKFASVAKLYTDLSGSQYKLNGKVCSKIIDHVKDFNVNTNTNNIFSSKNRFNVFTADDNSIILQIYLIEPEIDNIIPDNINESIFMRRVVQLLKFTLCNDYYDIEKEESPVKQTRPGCKSLAFEISSKEKFIYNQNILI